MKDREEDARASTHDSCALQDSLSKISIVDEI
jgi:hypothetical protein